VKTNPLVKYIQTIGIFGLITRLFLIWFSITFLIYPNVNLFLSVFIRDGQFSLVTVTRVLRSARAIRSLRNSFVLAFTLIITVNIVGTLLVLFTEYFKLRGAKILRAGYMTTLIYGGIVLASGYKFIYGSNGFLTRLLVQLFPTLDPGWFIGYPAVVFMMTFAVTSNHIIFLTNAVRGLDNQLIEAAKNLGENSFRIFFKIVLPILTPSMFAITILTFLTGLGALSAPLVVGGVNFQTINPMIVTFAGIPTSRDIAAFLAIILGVATMLLLAIMAKLEKGGTYISLAKTKTRFVKQEINSPVLRAIAHIVAYGLWLIYVVPIVLVVLYSFTDSNAILSGNFSTASMTLDNYITLFTRPAAFRPYMVSFVYSIIAGVSVGLLAVVVSKIIHKTKSTFDKSFEYVMMIPWLLPSTLIALGLLMSYDRPRLLLGNNALLGTTYLLLIGYIIIRIPFSLRIIRSAFFSIEDSLEESAKCMGASPFYTLRRVILPIILPTVIAVMVLNFNTLLSDYDLTVFLFHPLYQPLGIIIRASTEETASLNAVTMSFVYSVVLMIISALALFLTQSDWALRRNKK
jgi:iron(III) transport system permease protein